MVGKMKVAVVGLGVEGINAAKSLLDRGYYVYASDINSNIKLRLNENLDVDIGYHDFDKIENADAVVLSPSLWDQKYFQKYKTDGKLLSDVLRAHRSIFTIGITGTNGKTTTTMMIKDILQKAGMKVLIGGNAGGGFRGYTEVILEAASNVYDILLVEVCDMTLNFCRDSFDFDMVVVTNIGRDHLEIHQSLDNYLKMLKDFVKDKKVVLNQKNGIFEQLGDEAAETYYFSKIPYKLDLFGDFNLENAAAAAKTAEILGISDKDIKDALTEFSGLPGRSAVVELPNSRIVVGKTDNADAAAAVLNEAEFPVIIIGTPRKGELCRLEIFREVSKTNPKIVAIFPGLDNTLEEARNILKEEKYLGEIKDLSCVEEVVEFALECSKKYPNVFIGGNGQSKIMKITESLKEAILAK